MSIKKDYGKFRSSKGRLLGQSLFIDLAIKTISRADERLSLYAFGKKDITHEGKVYPSLYRLYLEMEDPIGYDFANKYLDGWKHLEELKKSRWFAPWFEEASEELKVRMRIKTIRQMQEKAAEGNVAAIKFMNERAWEDEGKSKAGRPSKKKIKEEAAKMIKDDESVLDDFSRIFKNEDGATVN